ncbi:hypothetical protein MOP88_09805 [Sphingomonas sp. WKB10]|nr:hypothetical protein [Sphingomonas sp. WKB10]
MASAGPPGSPRRAEAVTPAGLRAVQRIVGAGDDVAQAIGGVMPAMPQLMLSRTCVAASAAIGCWRNAAWIRVQIASPVS